jgi:hypothetical protein
MGRALEAGRRYALLVDAAWRDGRGQPLARSFRHECEAGPADDRPLDPVTWRIAAPEAGTLGPLEVGFPEPLNHGLLLRATPMLFNDPIPRFPR